MRVSALQHGVGAAGGSGRCVERDPRSRGKQASNKQTAEAAPAVAPAVAPVAAVVAVARLRAVTRRWLEMARLPQTRPLWEELASKAVEAL